MALLEVRNVSKHFGGLSALSEVDLQVEEREVVGLIGPNGAGKTTLFNVIAGFHKPSSGSIFFAGADIAGLKPYEVCRRGIVKTFQLTRPFLFLSVLDNVMTAAFCRTGDRTQAKEMAMELLNGLRLWDKAETLARNLTAGEQKKLGLATALATRPRLLLADEVMAGLTPKEALDLAESVSRLPQTGVTVIVVEHRVQAITGVCNRMVVLNFGRKIAEGTPREIVTNKEVISAYLGKDYAVASG